MATGPRTTKAPECRTTQQWVDQWLELQPLSRFGGPKERVEHPESLRYPSRTEPSDWALFWMRPRETIFGTILGLRSCSPRLSERNGDMDVENWSAWLNDVLWVLHRLLEQYVPTDMVQSGFSSPTASRLTERR